MGGVIQFPKERSKKVESEQSHRIFIALSAFSVFFVLASVNEQIIQSQRTQYIVTDNGSDKLFRNVASVHQASDLDWEKKVVDTLNQKNASIGSQLTMFQKFSVVELAGKYGIESDKGKVKLVRFIASENDERQDKPLQISEPKGFLFKYKALLAKSDFNEISLASDSQPQQPTYDLLLNKQKVGVAKFHYDEKGGLLSFSIE